LQPAIPAGCGKFGFVIMKYLFLTLSLLAAAVGAVFFVFRLPIKQEVVESPPKEWNSGAIRSSFSGIQIREVDPAHAEVVFSYDLENTTASDYHLASGPNVALVAQVKSDGSLRAPDAIRIDDSVFLPARSHGHFALKASRLFNWPSQMVAGQVGPLTQEKFRSLINNELSNVQQFILFDQATRYKIEFRAE
jgi:hypothetical protein